MRMMKTLWLLGAAALVLGLSGCGGGPSRVAPAAAPAAEIPPQLTLEEQLEAAEASLDEAEAELARLQADSSATNTQVADATKAVEDAGAAVNSLKQQIATRAGQLPLALDGKKLRAALTVMTRSDSSDFFSVANGGKVTAADPNGDDLDKKFEKSSSVHAPNLTSEGEGWTGSVYARSKMTAGDGTPAVDDDVTVGDMVTVYTDMEDPTYDEHYYSTYYSMAERSGVSGQAADGVLMLTARDIDVESLDDLIDAAGFPTGTDQTVAFTALTDAAKGLEGMFNGVPGSFWCSTSPCSATTDSDGKLSLADVNWRFTPDATVSALDTLVVRQKKPDPAFLTFGYWLRTTTDKDGDTYMVNTFAMGNALASGTLANVVGSAEYAGPAAGLFVKRETTAVGDGDPVSSGRFTARAALTAHFGGDAPQDKENSISGMISHFMHNGEMIDEEWIVKLMNADITAIDAVFTDTTMPVGNWRGNFYGGELKLTADTTDTPTNLAPPGSVAGTFEAEFNNGDVMGAFGATR